MQDLMSRRHILRWSSTNQITIADYAIIIYPGHFSSNTISCENTRQRKYSHTRLNEIILKIISYIKYTVSLKPHIKTTNDILTLSEQIDEHVDACLRSPEIRNARDIIIGTEIHMSSQNFWKEQISLRWKTRHRSWLRTLQHDCETILLVGHHFGREKIVSRFPKINSKNAHHGSIIIHPQTCRRDDVSR